MFAPSQEEKKMLAIYEAIDNLWLQGQIKGINIEIATSEARLNTLIQGCNIYEKDQIPYITNTAEIEFPQCRLDLINNEIIRIANLLNQYESAMQVRVKIYE